MKKPRQGGACGVGVELRSVQPRLSAQMLRAQPIA